MKLQAISAREASIFACATDTLLSPEPDLPPVNNTDAVTGFDDWMARSPAINRLGVRAGLYLLELSPLLTRGSRFRALVREQRREFLFPSGRRHPLVLAALIDTLRMLAAASYYGDDRVALTLGYDADARVERGRALRREESRP